MHRASFYVSVRLPMRGDLEHRLCCPPTNQLGPTERTRAHLFALHIAKGSPMIGS